MTPEDIRKFSCRHSLTNCCKINIKTSSWRWLQGTMNTIRNDKGPTKLDNILRPVIGYVCTCLAAFVVFGVRIKIMFVHAFCGLHFRTNPPFWIECGVPGRPKRGRRNYIAVNLQSVSPSSTTIKHGLSYT
jgi:hypothetical protein